MRTTVIFSREKRKVTVKTNQERLPLDKVSHESNLLKKKRKKKKILMCHCAYDNALFHKVIMVKSFVSNDHFQQNRIIKSIG